jgi:hypothetical protein
MAKTYKKTLYSFFVFVLLFLSSFIRPVIISVPGSFTPFVPAESSNWWRPTGNFYEKLREQGGILNENIISFSWSGVPSAHEIFVGGQRLAELIFFICKHLPNEKIILIGHSHGGNVIALASQILNNSVDNVINHYEKNLFSDDANMFEKTSVKTSNKKSLSQVCKEVLKKSLIRLKNLLPLYHKQKKRYLISEAYFLGTPINVKKFNPEMEVIGHLYSLYSVGDMIQSVVGKRVFPFYERVTNIQIIRPLSKL